MLENYDGNSQRKTFQPLVPEALDCAWKLSRWHINRENLSIKMMEQANSNEEESFYLIYNTPFLPVDTTKMI